MQNLQHFAAAVLVAASTLTSALATEVIRPGQLWYDTKGPWTRLQIDSRYVWLPVVFKGDRLEIPWQDNWRL